MLLTQKQVQCAKKKLHVFVERETEKVQQKNSTIEPVHPTNQTLHQDIFQEIFQFLPPRELAFLGASCKLLYCLSRDPALWVRHINELLLPLELSLSPEKCSKATYALLPKLPVTKTGQLLNMLEQNCLVRCLGLSDCCLYKEEVEEIFAASFHIPSPWSGRRIDQDLVNFPPTKHRSYRPHTFNSLDLSLHITDGFYRDLRPKFRITFGDDPATVPVVHCVSPEIYHPFVNSDGVVQLTILERWKPDLYTLRDIILEIESLFVDQKYLTSYFNC